MAYAAVTFLSAFLLFLVEPLLGKFLLPWFGGTPAVWTTCMLFFQIVLLLGYLYAHWADSRLMLRAQTRWHAVLLLSSLCLLAGFSLAWGGPLLPGSAWRPASPDSPILHILLILSASIGLPFLLLASTSPLLQRWYVREGRGSFPYRLYALSNAGSLLGLLGYPFLVEPTLAMPAQAILWTAGYAILVLFAALGALAVARRAAAAESPVAAGAEAVPPCAGARVRRFDVALWVLLPAVGSAMLLSVTNRLCLEIAAVPFLWVLPLVLYLLSFILCFQNPRGYSREWYVPALAVLTLVVLTAEMLALRLKIPAHVLAFSAFLFAFCMTVHGELVRARPPAEHLTRFYLAVAAGGALGGLFVGVIAPHAFSGFWEFHIAVLAGWILLVVVLARDPYSCLHAGDRRQAVIVFLLMAYFVLFPLLAPADLAYVPFLGRHPVVLRFTFAAVLAALLSALFWRRRWMRARLMPRLLAGTVIFAAECFALFDPRSGLRTTVARTRNFYGVLRVQNIEDRDGVVCRALVHGQTNHGYQLLKPELRNEPGSYYVRSSGVGLALEGHRRRQAGPGGGLPLRIGVTGLGAGGLAAYARTNDVIRFYEINPAVIAYAAGAAPLFTFVNDCRGKVEIAPGDARLSMERELREAGSQRYDVLILDAFSSDSVPVHLLTREAFDTYLAHLRDDGAIIAVNISNNFLDLRPVVFSAARAVGMEAALFNCAGEKPWPAKSAWVLMTRQRGFFTQPAVQERRAAYAPEGELIWTDRHSDLLRLLRWN